jgi:hypothetical protein
MDKAVISCVFVVPYCNHHDALSCLLLLLQVLLWPCHGGSNQRFERLADGSLRFPGETPTCDESSQL